MDKEEIRSRILKYGTDLVGFSDVSRLSDAPVGFAPNDVLPDCRTVISFAIAFPRGALHSPSPHIYTRIRNTISDKLNGIALDVCLYLESMGAASVPIPTVEDIPDKRTGRRYRSLVSLKHMAQAAGLGSIGRNTLLITPQYGSLIWLGGVLTELEISPDEPSEPLCLNCGKCVSACPVNALDEELMDQLACHNYAFGQMDGNFTISCHLCRIFDRNDRLYTRFSRTYMPTIILVCRHASALIPLYNQYKAKDVEFVGVAREWLIGEGFTIQNGRIIRN